MIATDYIFGKKGVKESNYPTNVQFDVIGGSSFLIRRGTDDVEKFFTNNEIHNGTYETWLNGGEGYVKEWITGQNKFSDPPLSSNQMKLSTAGYLDAFALGCRLDWVDHNLNLGGDYVITLITHREGNANNYRFSFSIKGTGDDGFVMNFDSRGRIYLTSYYPEGLSNFPSEYWYNYSNTEVFRLWTFAKINGVFRAFHNANEMTPTGQIYSPIGGFNTDWTARLNQLKINKYKHIGFITGAEATELNIESHITEIMTRYGI